MSGCSCNTCPTCATQTFRNAVLPGLSAADAVMATLDLAPYSVSIITRRWSGGRPKSGTPGDTVLQLPPWIVCKEVTEDQVRQSGGRFEIGDLWVGPIRPYFTGPSCNGVPGAPGGFTQEQLNPIIEAGDESTEIIYRVRQTHGLGSGTNGDYDLHRLHADDPLEYMLLLRRHHQTRDPVTPLGL